MQYHQCAEEPNEIPLCRLADPQTMGCEALVAIRVLTVPAISANASYREKLFCNLCACSRYCERARTVCTEVRICSGLGRLVSRLMPAPVQPTRAAVNAFSSVSPAATSGTPKLSACCTAPYPPLVISTSTFGRSRTKGTNASTFALVGAIRSPVSE